MTVGSRIGVASLRPARRVPGLPTLGLEPAGETLLGSAMRAGSTEPDGVLRYQVRPAPRPSPGAASSSPVHLPASAPPLDPEATP